MNMKLRPTQDLTQQQISDKRIWEHPWNAHMRKWDAEKHWENQLKKPNPPSTEAIEKAKFVDKTYQWSRSDSLRHGDKRTSK